MTKIVVLGGSGFLGSHVADSLSAEGYRVVVADKHPSRYLRDDQEMAVGDVLDSEFLRQVIRDARYVYHLAGIADIADAALDPLKTVKVNILGTTNVLETCRQQKVERILFASSVYVYSNHGSFYRCSKQACEKLIECYQEKYGLDYAILRYGSLYGPRAGETNSVYRFIEQALIDKEIVRDGDGEELREYIHVQDAASLSIKALGPEYINKHVMITGMQSMKIKDMLAMIQEIMGRQEVTIKYNRDNVLEHHYEITPYSFKVVSAKKIVGTDYYDLGQGILELIHEVNKHVMGNN